MPPCPPEIGALPAGGEERHTDSKWFSSGPMCILGGSQTPRLYYKDLTFIVFLIIYSSMCICGYLKNPEEGVGSPEITGSWSPDMGAWCAFHQDIFLWTCAVSFNISSQQSRSEPSTSEDVTFGGRIGCGQCCSLIPPLILSGPGGAWCY